MGDKHKIGRNDPCPCGSGKKYKNCCYPDRTQAWKTAGSHESPAFTVEPKETPEPITHHLVSSNGGKTWKSEPGLLAVQLYGRDPKDIDETISKMMKSVSSILDTLRLSTAVKQDLVKHISDVEHKLHAVKYHLNNYEQAESDKIKEFSKNYKPPAGVQMVTEEPRLIYEVESFLFQTKSCLDVLSWVLKPAFGFTYCSFGDKGDAIINQLKNNCPAKLATYAENVIKLIEDVQDVWIVELVDMRDKVTHYSRLEGFNCFLEDPYVRGSTTNIHYPTMPNTQRALEYCQDVWQRLLSFCEEFLRLALEASGISR
ncbi:hypothetical protein ES704_01823 [subsurface metagenome]|jgi:hypothetical protein